LRRASGTDIAGMSWAVNRDMRTLNGAFVATMKWPHWNFLLAWQGTQTRISPADVLLHEDEA
jgi:hypothetical protein